MGRRKEAHGNATRTNAVATRANDGNDDVEFYVTKPANGEPATYGNGTQVSFLTENRTQVEKFHETGLELGGKSEGNPGLRPSDGEVYYSYIRDLEGNKVCAYTNSKG